MNETKIKELQEGSEMVPTSKEIMNEMAKMKDSAPGDGIRLGFIKKASKEIQDVVVERSRKCGIVRLLYGKSY